MNEKEIVLKLGKIVEEIAEAKELIPKVREILWTWEKETLIEAMINEMTLNELRQLIEDNE